MHMLCAAHCACQPPQLLCHDQQHLIVIIHALPHIGHQLTASALWAQGCCYGWQLLHGVQPALHITVLQLIYEDGYLVQVSV
jgi:hypothetical protein